MSRVCEVYNLKECVEGKGSKGERKGILDILLEDFQPRMDVTCEELRLYMRLQGKFN